MIEGFKIVDFNDIEKPLTDFHKYGAKAGKFVGFDAFDGKYSMQESGVTEWTGYPQSGKTELLLELLFNMSEFYGWKHLLYVPDIGDCIEVMAILIHKYTGKTFEKRYPNYIDIRTAFNAVSWIRQHFFILEKKNPRASITPMEFWDLAAQFKNEHGIQTAIIDSWKDMKHDYSKFGGSYAMYLSEILPYRNMVSEQNNLHFHTVVHPKNARRQNGKIVHPDVDDMEGGAQWNNNGKSIISVHRATYDSKFADIKILKAKPRSVGQRGFLQLGFSPAKSRYYEMSPGENGEGVKIWAHKKQEPPTIIQSEDIFNGL